jgi:hypothetical protein
MKWKLDEYEHRVFVQARLLHKKVFIRGNHFAITVGVKARTGIVIWTKLHAE